MHKQEMKAHLLCRTLAGSQAVNVTVCNDNLQMWNSEGMIKSFCAKRPVQTVTFAFWNSEKLSAIVLGFHQSQKSTFLQAKS